MQLRKFFRPTILSYILQRLCTWYPLRGALSAGLASVKPRHDSPKSEQMDIRIQELERNGITFLNAFVTAETIDRIKNHLQGALLSERFGSRRSNFTINKVPVNVHVAEYTTNHILQCPEVLALANHPTIVDTAAGYLGCKPTISNISIWWSFPADGSAQEAENFHRDVDEWRFVKFFLYLTDVDADAGPHCFVRGSHRASKFLRIRRISDDEVGRGFPEEDMLCIQGCAGDGFLEDTFGLHKGQPPNRTRRLLFQVEYSINPIAVYDYKSMAYELSKTNFDPYINRLYLSGKRG